MQVKDAIKQIVTKSGKTHRTIAADMGRSPAYVSNLVTTRPDPQAGTLAELAGACGYELVLVPREGGDQIALEPNDKQGR